MKNSAANFNPSELCRPTVKNLRPYSSARDEYVSTGGEMVFLDANENPYETGVNRYPDPLQRSFKKAWAQEKGISESQILIGNGSDEVLDLLFRAFCEPHKDKVITLPPTYGMYKVLCGINAVENIEIPLTPNFEIEVAAVLKGILPTAKLLFICSPNNPSGNLMDFKSISSILKEFSGIVVIDEAYIDFTAAPSWVSFLEQYPNLVVVQTLSKAYGMAGIRLGVLMASKDIVNLLLKIKPPYNVNVLTQEKALQRLQVKNVIATEVATIIKEREILVKALQKIPFVEKVFPTTANFILARVDCAEKRYSQLIDQGIVVRNRSKQLHCNNTLRFTVGTPKENIKLIKTLSKLP